MDFCIVEKSAEDIDKKGIREANRQAMSEIILQLLKIYLQKNNSSLDHKILILIDGSDNFRFPELEEKYFCEYFFARKKSRQNSDDSQSKFLEKIASENPV